MTKRKILALAIVSSVLIASNSLAYSILGTQPTVDQEGSLHWSYSATNTMAWGGPDPWNFGSDGPIAFIKFTIVPDSEDGDIKFVGATSLEQWFETLSSVGGATGQWGAYFNCSQSGIYSYAEGNYNNIYYGNVAAGTHDIEGFCFVPSVEYEIVIHWDFAGYYHPGDSNSYWEGSGGFNFDFELTQAGASVPEPSTMLLLGCGLLGLVGLNRRDKE